MATSPDSNSHSIDILPRLQAGEDVKLRHGGVSVLSSGA